VVQIFHKYFLISNLVRHRARHDAVCFRWIFPRRDEPHNSAGKLCGSGEVTSYKKRCLRFATRENPNYKQKQDGADRGVDDHGDNASSKMDADLRHNHSPMNAR
jgi:hypothetical protein